MAARKARRKTPAKSSSSADLRIDRASGLWNQEPDRWTRVIGGVVGAIHHDSDLVAGAQGTGVDVADIARHLPDDVRAVLQSSDGLLHAVRVYQRNRATVSTLAQPIRAWSAEDCRTSGIDLLVAAIQAVPTTDRGVTIGTAIIDAAKIRPFIPRTTSSMPRLSRASEVNTLPDLPGHRPIGPANNLPQFAHAEPASASILAMTPYVRVFGNVGARQRGGCGASLALRLVVVALATLPVGSRNGGRHRFDLTLDELVQLAFPHGWPGRKRDLDALNRAAQEVYRCSCVTFPDGSWKNLAVIMGGPASLRNRAIPYELQVLVPPQAAKGFAVDFRALMAYGQTDALAFRGYLTAAALMDATARRGHGITRTIGRPQVDDTTGRHKRRRGRLVRDTGDQVPNPSSRYVTNLTRAQLSWMVGLSPADRRDARRAVNTFKGLDADGCIEFVQIDADAYKVFAPNPAARDQPPLPTGNQPSLRRGTSHLCDKAHTPSGQNRQSQTQDSSEPKNGPLELPLSIPLRR